MNKVHGFLIKLIIPLFFSSCLSQLDLDRLDGDQAHTTIVMDFLHKPLPNIPLPNDIATIYDGQSATKRRVNASMIATTLLESKIRQKVDQLDGWGVNQPITIPFSGPIDLNSILAGHRDAFYAFEKNVVYLLNLTKAKMGVLELIPLDVGHGNYPVLLEEYGSKGEYGEGDPRGWTNSLMYEEAFEDRNLNGVLDGDEDMDGDGILDIPNYLDELQSEDEFKALFNDDRKRADLLLDFYEKETNTLIVKPLIPLNERSEYAVIVTKRIKDMAQNPIGSPFPQIIHQSQSEALSYIKKVLPPYLDFEEIAFVFTYTTQSLQAHWVAVREGLYGYGIQSHLAEEFKSEIAEIYSLKNMTHPDFKDGKQEYVLYHEELFKNFSGILDLVGGSLDKNSYQFRELKESISYIDYHIFGRFKSPQLFPKYYSDLDGDMPSCEQVCEHQVSCYFEQPSAHEGDFNANQSPEIVLDGCIAKCIENEQNLALLETQDIAIFDIPNLNGQRKCLMDRCQAFEECQDLNPYLPYDAQIWPNDLDRKKAKARSEDIYFWLTIPRKEVAQLKEGEVFPVVMVGHGYTLHKLDAMMGFAGQLAKRGNASIAIDCVGHGLVFPENYQSLGRNLAKTFGLEKIIDPLLYGRAFDLNRDQVADSGADFWTSYLFHTRDQVRQCTLDYMQLVRILRSFGDQKWRWDMNGDGVENDLAGDFNGDGQIDIGGKNGIIGITGTSLGGIMAGIVAGLEPGVDISVPIAGGGVLSDIGVRSLQGGVKEAVAYRLMSPMYTAELIGNELKLYSTLPQLNQSEKIELFSTTEVEIGDTMMVVNLKNQERRCVLISDQHPDLDQYKKKDISAFNRVSIQSDLHDLTEFRFFKGNVLSSCQNQDGPAPFKVINRIDKEIHFQGLTFKSNSRIKALAEGLGLERNTPRFRRFFHLSQLVLDAGDPATFARHWLKEPLVYPQVKDQTGTHMMVVTTTGDMNVPANSSVSMARAGGLIDWTKPNPKYDQHPEYQGLSSTDILIKTQAVEAIHHISRFKDKNGNHTHLDIENFSQSTDQVGDIWVENGVPRLEPPLRLGMDQKDPLGGISAAIFPFIKPEGWHGFSFPGQEQDIRLKSCLEKKSCSNAQEDPCVQSCREEVEKQFDLGNFMSALLGMYMRSGAQEINAEACISWGGCHEAPPPPTPRSLPISIK